MWKSAAYTVHHTKQLKIKRQHTLLRAYIMRRWTNFNRKWDQGVVIYCTSVNVLET